jgi:hypothetical protein
VAAGFSISVAGRLSVAVMTVMHFAQKDHAAEMPRAN